MHTPRDNRASMADDSSGSRFLKPEVKPLLEVLRVDHRLLVLAAHNKSPLLATTTLVH